MGHFLVAAKGGARFNIPSPEFCCTARRGLCSWHDHFANADRNGRDCALTSREVMAIEFYCPGCGELMSTPDTTAGGKGRCPYCQTKVRIPRASMLKGSSSAAQSIFDFDPNAGRGPPSASAGYIQFRCQHCQTNLRIPSTNAGKKGQCPHCNATMQIPAAAATSTSAPPTVTEKKTSSEKKKGAPKPLASGNLQFSCPSCHDVVQVSAAAAGKRGRCPRCQSVIQIPFSSPLDDG